MNQDKSFNKFLILWSGELISIIGSGLTSFGLGVYVFQTTNNASSVALVTLLAFLPTILLSAPAGVLADRFDRRLLMIIGDGLSALGLIYILICMFNEKATLLNICIGVLISSIFSSLLEPSYRATITDLLTEEQFAKASGFVQMAGSSKFLLSPIIAGFLLSVSTIELLLIIDIATFFITVSTTLFVKKGLKSTSKATDNSFIEDFKIGFNAIRSNKGIFILIILMSVMTFYLGFIQTLFTPLVLSFSDSKTLGTMETISAMGMLFSSLIIGMAHIKNNYTKMLGIGFICSGIFMAGVGSRANLLIIGLFGFLFFASLPFINTSADCLVRMNIENSLQGRVWGLIGIISQLGYVTAYAIVGFLADNIFEPMLSENGILNDSIGKIIGVGQGRGIGFLLIVGGIFMIITAVLMLNNKSIKSLEV